MSKQKILILKESTTFNPQPQKVKDHLFQENDFFDANDLLQVKYEMLRKVCKDGWDISKAAKTFGFSRPSFYKACSAYQAKGLVGLLSQKRGPKEPHKLTATVIRHIKKRLSKNPRLTPKELSQEIEEKFSLCIHPRSIERALKSPKKKR